MNVLIVDDDFYVVESLQKSISWSGIGINNVYTSYNVKNAKRILSSEKVHIVLCDIEMPKENGLELLKWVREEEILVEVIFLTSYSEFDYASTAINLQAFSYLLKPVANDKLLEIVKNAMEKMKFNLETKEYLIAHERWSETLKTRKDAFWTKALIDSRFEKNSDYTEYIKKYDLEYRPDDLFKFIHIEITGYEKVYKEVGKGMFNYKYKTTIENCFEEIEGSIRKDRRTYIIVFKKLDYQESFLKELIYSVEKTLKCRCYCFMSNIAKLYNVNREYQNIVNFRPTITFGNKNILYPNDIKTIVTIHNPPNFYLWETLITDEKKSDMLKLIDEYFSQFDDRAFINKNIISQFLVELLQVLYNANKKRRKEGEISTYDKNKMDFFQQATLSLENAIYYSKTLVEQTIDNIKKENESKSTVDIIKYYIRDNIDTDITREVLSGQVFLNPDYLSKLFKKETGISLGTYITSERIKLAKEYLENTNEQIYSIALKVGYDNFSYFSRIFKEATGLTPKQYKSKKSSKK